MTLKIKLLLLLALFSNGKLASCEISVPKEWECVETGWPIEDKLDTFNGKRSQFFYNKDVDISNQDPNSNYVVTIKESFLKEVKDRSGFFKFSFKFWFYNELKNDKRSGVTLSTQEFQYEILERHNSSFDGRWMPNEYILSYDSLANLKIIILISNRKTTIAFKDFKLEYETQDLKPNSIEDSSKEIGIFTNEWNRYINPPKDEIEEIEKFSYFSDKDCENGCNLKIITHKLHDDQIQNINKTELSFKYWIKGGKETTIESINEANITRNSDKWQSITLTLPKDQYNNFNISIKTKAKLKDDLSFVAIKIISVAVYLNEKSNSSTENNTIWFYCKKTGVCDLSATPKLYQTSYKPQLHNSIYYYPRSINNSITYTGHDDIFKHDICFTMEYMASKIKITILNVFYSTLNEKTIDRILSIKPSSSVPLELYEFCLREHIAITSKNYTIKLNVRQHDYDEGIEGYAMKLIEPSINEPNLDWNIEKKSFKFLQKMEITTTEEDDSYQGSWKNQWTPLRGSNEKMFQIEDNKIHFKALSSSQIPASGQIMSEWIKYDELLNKESNYKIVVTKIESFNKFTIKPKICDWLSHCKDVIIDPNFKSNDTNGLYTRLYSFKFIPLNNTKYIKLVFNVEYFKISKDEEEFIEFDFSLTHFGDPCGMPLKCTHNETCIKSDPRFDTPNEPKCKCNQSYTGDLCEIKDMCSFRENNLKSGSFQCRQKNPTLKCENLKDIGKFRCVCNQGNSINWNGTDCVDVPVNPVGWDHKNNSYFPNNLNNSLIFHFENINTKRFKIFSKFTCSIKQLVSINFFYKDDKNESLLFDIILSKELNNIITFSLNEFIYDVNESFSLIISISKTENNTYSQDVFSIEKFEFWVEPLKPTDEVITHISNWDNRKKSDDPINHWRRFPENSFVPHNDTAGKFSIEFKGQNEVTQKNLTAFLISDWIEKNIDFSHSENLYQLKYAKNLSQQFNIVQQILYVKGGKVERKEKKLYITNEHDAGQNNVISNQAIADLDLKIDSPFKLIIKISYKNVQGFKLFIQNFTMGDPCISVKNNKETCKHDSECIPLGPLKYVCKCVDSIYGGLNCEYKNVCKEKKKYCNEMPSLPKSDGNECTVLSNETFKCNCAEPDYVWDTDKKRCARNTFSKNLKTCDGINCEFLNSIKGNSSWSNMNIPKLESEEDYKTMLPFYYPKKSGVPLKVNLKKSNSTSDSCVNIRYFVKGKSVLNFGVNDNVPLEIPASEIGQSISWLPIKIPGQNSGELVCLRDWSKPSDNSAVITFNSVINDMTNDIIAIQFWKFNASLQDFNFTKSIEEKLLKELPYLTHFDETDKNYTYVHQWPIAFPTFNWEPEGNSTVFKVKDKNSIPQFSYLLSQWLRPEASNHKFRFNFKILDEYKGFVLRVLALDDKMKSIPTDIIIGDERLDKNANNNVTQTVVTMIKKMETSFRIALKVEYQSSVNKERRIFSINSIDLADPCVDDQAIYNLCNGQGNCSRDLTKYTYTCKCNEGYKNDSDCKNKDYCNSQQTMPDRSERKGNDFCKEQKYSQGCVNTGIYFECNCSTNTFWVNSTESYGCHQIPKCLNKDCDTEKQVCKEPPSPEEQAYCDCNEDKNYFNFSKTNELNCVKYDPCDASHSNLDKPCGDSKARCLSFGSGKDDYTCICPEGTKNKDDRQFSECIPEYCSFPSLNNCEQNCNLANEKDKNYTCSCEKLYDPDGAKCNLKKGENCTCKGKAYCVENSNDCHCKDGYKIDLVVGCKPDLDKKTDLCPYENVTSNSNHELICDCGTSFQLNSKNICDLKPICGKEGIGRKICNLKNALCVTNITSEEDYSCKCPMGQDFDLPVADEKARCFDKCELKQRKEICISRNALCDPVKVDQDDVDPSNYCVCRPGFIAKYEAKNFTCRLGEFTKELSLTIKNTFNDHDFKKKPNMMMPESQNASRAKRSVQSFHTISDNKVKDIQSMNDENNKIQAKFINMSLHYNLTQLLKARMKVILSLTNNDVPEDNIAVEKCFLNAQKFYECTFTITFDKSFKDLENLNKELTELCKPSILDKNLCFFRNPNFNANTNPDLYLIAVNFEKLKNAKFIKYQPCEKSRRTDNCPELTDCQEDKETSFYNCTCNTDYFISNGQDTFIPLHGSNKKFVKQSCKVREDICDKYCPSKKNNGQCIKTPPKTDTNNNWIVKPFCYCDDGYLISNDSKQCSAVCSDQVCNNHGSCKTRGSTGFTCDCHDGWGGDNCNKEFKNAVGGWIAGIVVLAVLLVIAAGVAIIFARRAKTTSYSSGQQLDEYTGPSFRSNTGASPSRNQPAYQGRDNQAFHRD